MEEITGPGKTGRMREVVGPDFDAGELADEVDTIGGLIFDIAGHVPAPGEVVKGVNGVAGFSFEILAADGRQILKLKIKRSRERKPRPRPPLKPGAAAEAEPADEEARTG